ncbi:MAG: ATP-binding protein [Polyangiales bacterium]
MISLQVPALLTYRDVAMRVVSASCKIFAMQAKQPQEFQDHVVSALGEAFNNTVIHAYRGRSDGRVTIEIEPQAEMLEIRIIDNGVSFDLSAVPTPELDDLPESGMGLFIIRSFMDEVAYRSGPPNVLSLRKRL